MLRQLIFLIAFSFLLSVAGIAQKSGYLGGYIVTMAGDSIQGQLKEFGQVRSCSVVKFIGADGKKRKFYPDELMAYKRGREVFHSRRYSQPMQFMGPEFKFMQLLVKGPVKLYEFFYTSQGAMMMEGAGGGMTSTSSVTQVYMLYQNGISESAKRLKYRKWALGYFTGNPDIQAKIQNRDYRYFDLPTLVEDYNKWLNRD